MAERRISVLDIRSDVDQAKRASRAIAELRQEITSARTEFERSDRSAGDLVKAQGLIVDAVVETKKAFDAGKVSAQQFLDVVSEATRTAKPATRSAGGGGNSTRERIDKFGSFASQVFSGFGAGELGGVAGLVGDVASGIGSLGPAAVAGTVAVGALTLALDAARKQTEEVARATKARIDAEREAADFLRRASTEQTQQRIEEVRSQIAFEQEQFRRLSAERDALLQNTVLSPNDPVLSGLNLFRQRIGVAFGEVWALDEALKESSQTLSDLTVKNRELSFAAASGAQAVNDLKLAAEELSQLRQSKVDKYLSEITDLTRFDQQLRDANEATTRRMLQSEQDRIEILEAQRNILETFNDGSAEATQQLEALDAQLQNASLNVKQLTERLSGFTGVRSVLSIFDNIGAGIRNMLSGAQRDLQEQAEKAKRLESAVRPILDEISKLGIEAAKKDAEYLVKRADIEADFTKQALRDAANFARQRIKIERDAASSMFSAVARRDAQAFFEARERRKEQLDDLRDDAEAQAKLREEERRDKLQALEREIADFRQSNAQKRAELQRQYAYEINAERARLTTAQSAAVARATIEQAGANTVLGIARNFWINMINQAQSAANAAAARSAVATTTSVTTDANAIARTIAGRIARSAL